MFKLDLFNKKKIKKLEQEVYDLNNDIEGYKKTKEIGVNKLTIWRKYQLKQWKKIKN